MTIQEIIAVVLMLLGFVFMLISTIGLFRFPDFTTRLHSAGIGDTLAAFLVIAGMVVLIGFKLISLKIILIPLILFLTGPMASNMILSAAVHKHDYQNYNEKRPANELEKNDLKGLENPDTAVDIKGDKRG